MFQRFNMDVYHYLFQYDPIIFSGWTLQKHCTSTTSFNGSTHREDLSKLDHWVVLKECRRIQATTLSVVICWWSRHYLLVIKHGNGKFPMNGGFNRKHAYFYSPFSSSPCLIIGGWPLPSGKLRWLWKITIFMRKVHDKGSCVLYTSSN